MTKEKCSKPKRKMPPVSTSFRRFPAKKSNGRHSMISEDEALRAVVGILHEDKVCTRRPYRLPDEKDRGVAILLKPLRRQHKAVKDDHGVLAEVETVYRHLLVLLDLDARDLRDDGWRARQHFKVDA